MNLGNQPVEILIEDVYLLVVPSSQANVNPEEEERRAQAAKADRLENAELLHMRDQADVSSGGFQGRSKCGASATHYITEQIHPSHKGYGHR
jgi:vacuolar protein sorting-associated protein 13A/C